MRSLCLVVFACLISAPAAAAENSAIEYLKPQGLWNVPLFSQVTTARGGKLVFVSGQLSWDEQGKPLFPGDLEAQTRKAYENMKLALASVGATLDDVVKYTLYVKNIDSTKWKQISKVRREFISQERPPASTMIGVTGLVLDDLLIEIEAYALIKE